MTHSPSPKTLQTVGIAALTSLVVSGIVALGTISVLQRQGRSMAISPQDSRGVFQGKQTDIVDAVSRTEPAVVSIIVSQDVAVMERRFSGPFGPFGLRIPQYRQRGTQRQEVGGGTAFFVSSDGLLMTNKHVVNDEKATYTVFLNDGRKLEATVIGKDPTNDIALLRVKGTNFPSLRLSEKDDVQLGETVIAIGNALGEFRNTVSVGVVAGLSRSIEAEGDQRTGTARLSHIIQTDAAINPGNSGGPLLNTHGEVIGMNTAVASDAQNIGFALPAAELRKVLESYQTHGRIVRPYLGIRYVPVTPEVQKELKLPTDYGMLIASGYRRDERAVLPGSPADKAGLTEDDIILSIDGKRLTEQDSLPAAIRDKQPGESVTLRVIHRGREKSVTVQLDEWKSEE